MNEFKKLSTGELIPFYSASLSSDANSWLWTFNASVGDLATLAKLKPVQSLGADYVEVSFKLGLETWGMVIENITSADTNHDFSITGRSRSVLLAEPYAAEITKTWTDTTAQSIAQELCDNVGVYLVWAVMDWNIKSYVADKRYPIDIINELAGDLGALVQSLPNGSLTVIYHPVCGPNKIYLQSPDFSLSTSTNLFSRDRQFINNRNYNAVLVTVENSGNSATPPTVSIADQADGIDRLVKVTVSPFVPVSEINLRNASGDNVSVCYEGVYTETVTDQLIVQNGKAQLSKPFDNLISVQWHQDVVGTLSIDSRGAISTSEGFGLVTVVYGSAYHQYRVSNLTGVDLTAVAVDEIATPVDVSAMSLLYIIGEGDRPAPPVIVKTLSSLVSLVKRGEAELWQQIYDTDDYQIECVYENTPMLVGKIAQVDILNENITFNGYIKSVSISLDKTIVQTAVIERPLL